MTSPLYDDVQRRTRKRFYPAFVVALLLTGIFMSAIKLIAYVDKQSRVGIHAHSWPTQTLTVLASNLRASRPLVARPILLSLPPSPRPRRAPSDVVLPST